MNNSELKEIRDKINYTEFLILLQQYGYFPPDREFWADGRIKCNNRLMCINQSVGRSKLYQKAHVVNMSNFERRK